MDPSFTGGDPCVHQAVWSQASFLKVSFWQQVFAKKTFSLGKLAGPSLEVQHPPKEGYRVTQCHTKEQ